MKGLRCIGWIAIGAVMLLVSVSRSNPFHAEWLLKEGSNFDQEGRQ
ncbi:MAG: hypothetical protein ACYTEE_09385 [Planctomycetota bacterium]|jgi:hypothetical protein